jgi:hypothetical protein
LRLVAQRQHAARALRRRALEQLARRLERAHLHGEMQRTVARLASERHAQQRHVDAAMREKRRDQLGLVPRDELVQHSHSIVVGCIHIQFGILQQVQKSLIRQRRFDQLCQAQTIAVAAPTAAATATRM